MLLTSLIKRELNILTLSYFSRSNYIKSKTLYIVSPLISCFCNTLNNSFKIVITPSSLSLSISSLSAFSLYIINAIITLRFRFISSLSRYINNSDNLNNSAAAAPNPSSPPSSLLLIRSWYYRPVAREEKNRENILLFILLNLRNISLTYTL